MKERRKFARYTDSAMPARHRCADSETVRKNHATDVSTGGMRMRSSIPMLPGTKLTTEICVPGTDRPFYAFSEVIWCEKNEAAGENIYDVGIRFVQIVSKARITGF